ncbi:class II aldolase/adducin family protein [Alteromonas lipolytica]|uniref:Class II aldolase n=1 Tax=Alteromonas lipolytica TaxID=1856405 RepID=A0A1E8FJ64_9ALTE|nr:class II aldolase/adducin family protein [Alteromonas lipolytica]OFI35483.1 class II aldolase [Alteromonas lipolytica]GGF76644.1 class II aldolase [Alteromonas lipolytica]
MAEINAEHELRKDLAAAYRLLDLEGWSDMIFTHISARLPDSDDRFLLNSYGLLPEEVCASNLVLVDVQGENAGSSPATVNPAGFTIHSALHMARDDAHCVMHTHTMAGMAVSGLAEGLLPVNQTSMEFFNRIAYYDYQGIPLECDEREAIVAAMGDKNSMILRNHGLLTVGRTVAEAFYRMYYLNKACEIQVETMKTGGTLLIPSDDVCEHVAQQASSPRYMAQSIDLIWQAMIRKLDRIDPSYRN